MSDIHELERQLQQAKLKELAKKHEEKRTAIDKFTEETGIDVYTSDDYAGLSLGNLHFYYGYEVTEDDEWCFTVTKGDRELFKMPMSKLHPEKDEVPFWYLVAGIGHYLRDKLSGNTPKEGKE